jgi:hypothetical protein
MGIETRRKRFSWLLLSVFLPMMLFSVLHTHQGEVHATEVCQDCLHHVHHSHIVSAKACIDHCVLCEFQTIPFVKAQSVFSFLPTVGHHVVFILPSAVAVCHRAGILIPRAPPIFV